MKTFNEKDLITWANREKAVIGNEYYFANRFSDLKDAIKNEETHTLYKIDNNCIMQPFEINPQYVAFACLLPVEAVKDEKTYRACKTIQEFYHMAYVSPILEETIDGIICDLIGITIHFRDKYQNEFYTIITQIRIIDDEYLIGLNGAAFNFNELFNNFEIELKGEWKPFGVIDND